MSNLGIGYEFGARDAGQKAAFDGAEKSLDTINNLLGQQSVESSKASKAMGSFSKKIKDFNIASIAKNVRSLTGETGSLSNELESAAFQARTAAKPILAQMNLTSEQHRQMMSRVSGMAVSMNVGGEVIAEMFRSIETASEDAQAGIDAMAMSEREWVKVIQTTGVPMEAYQAVLGNMISSWNASPDAAAEMVNNMLAIGKAADIGADGLKGMKGQMDAVDTVFEKLPPSAARSADEIKSLMESTVGLAGAFKDMGEETGKSVELAQSTAMMFAEQSVAITRAKQGLGGSVADNPLHKFLTQLGVGYEEALDIIDTGSRDAVKGTMMLQDAVQRMMVADPQRADRVMSELNRTMGESAGGLAYLVGNMDKGSASLEKMNNLAVDGTGALKKYGKAAFSDSRNLQEQFNFAKESFDTQIRAITRGDVRKLVGKQMAAYKESAKEFKEMAGEDGALGGLIRTASKFKQMGMTGVFLDIAGAMGVGAKEAKKYAIKFDFAFDSISKFGEEIAPMMEMLQAFGPLGLLAGGIAGFFMLGNKEQRAILDTIGDLYYKAVDKFEKVVIPGIIKYWPEIAKGAKAIWKYITEEIPWQKLGDEVIWPAMENLGSFIWKGLKWAWEKVGEEFGTGGQLAIGASLIGAISPGLLGLAGQFVGTISAGFGPLGLIGVAVAAASLAIVTAFETLARQGDKAAEEKGALFGAVKGRAAQTMGSVQGTQKDYTEAFGTTGEFQANIDELIKEGELSKADISAFTDKRDYGKFISLGTDSEFGADTMLEFKKSLKMQGRIDTLGGKAATQVANEMSAFLTRVQDIPAVQKQLQAASQLGAKEMASTIEHLWLNQAAFTDEQTESLIAQGSAIEQQILGWQALGGGMSEAGMQLGEDYASGIVDSVPAVEDAAEGFATGVSNVTVGQSPIPEGPLADDALYWSGLHLGTLFADGFANSSEYIAEMVGQTLDESVMKTIEEYDAKMENLMKQKDLLDKVAKSIVKGFGGDIKSAEFEGEKINVEKRMEAMINIPGMAGVVAAVIKSGADTQVILKKIYQETKRTADGVEANSSNRPQPQLQRS